MKISDEILGILSRCTVDGNTLYLPDEQLDRKTYTAVNKCLVNIGGKWNRKAKGFDVVDWRNCGYEKGLSVLSYAQGDCAADVSNG